MLQTMTLLVVVMVSLAIMLLALSAAAEEDFDRSLELEMYPRTQDQIQWALASLPSSGGQGQGQSVQLTLSEMKALGVLYSALGSGVKWKWQSNVTTYGMRWNFSQTQQGSYLHDPCAELWQGVYCSCKYTMRPVFKSDFYYYDDVPQGDTSLCSVVKIGLVNFGLSGTLPNAAFSAFKNLTHLYLPQNKIRGNFTTSLCTLSTSLRTLSLLGNKVTGKLTGKLPSSCVGRLTNLEIFYLAYNSFSGSLPSSIGQLTRLKFLRIKKNRFTGTLPSSIGNLGSLSYFSLGINSIKGKSAMS